MPHANVRLKTPSQIQHFSAIAYQRRQSGVCNTQHRLPILSRTQDRVSEVLSHHGVRTEIPIVRDIDQQVGAVATEPASNPRIRGLYTDVHSHTSVADAHQSVTITGCELTDESSYQRRSRQP